MTILDLFLVLIESVFDPFLAFIKSAFDLVSDMIMIFPCNIQEFAYHAFLFIVYLIFFAKWHGHKQVMISLFQITSKRSLNKSFQSFIHQAFVHFSFTVVVPLF